MQHFFEMPDMLSLVADKLDFKDARKLPFLCRTTRDAVGWRELLERRTVRFKHGCKAEYLVRGSGWINHVRKASVFKKSPKMKTATVNNQKRKIYLRHVGPRAIEAMRYDAANLGWKGRDFTAEDRFIPGEHDVYMKNVNDHWLHCS